jgi:hypothetical protein
VWAIRLVFSILVGSELGDWRFFREMLMMTFWVDGHCIALVLASCTAATCAIRMSRLGFTAHFFEGGVLLPLVNGFRLMCLRSFLMCHSALGMKRSGQRRRGETTKVHG